MSLINTHRWMKTNPYLTPCNYKLEEHEYFQKYNAQIRSPYLFVKRGANFTSLDHSIDFFSYVDSYCIELLQKSQAKFIVDATDEGSNCLEPSFVYLLEQSATKNSIPHDNIFYLSIDIYESNLESKINNLYYNGLTAMVLRFESQLNQNQSKSRNYIFSCLNRKPRYWRLKLQQELLTSEVADDIICSYPEIDDIKNVYTKPHIIENDSMINFFTTRGKKFYGNDTNPGRLLEEIYSDVMFDVAMTTFQEGSENVVDEKVFKPMLSMIPVIIWGVPGINTMSLPHLGFKTYEDWFDLSFDQEPNTRKRLELLKKEILNLSSKLKDMSPDKKLEWINKNQNVLEHNRNLIKDFTPNNISFSKFIKLVNTI